MEVQRELSQIIRSEIKDPRIHPLTSVVAVSYTHLDVYKRQIIHCGGCMLNGKEMKYRIKCACDQNVPITNYGMTIALSLIHI